MTSRGPGDPGDPRRIVAEGYDAIVEAYAVWAERVRDTVRDRLLAELASRLPDGARVLDVGSGSGVPWTARLVQRFEVTGVDISAGQIEAARRNVPGATFIVGDTEEPEGRAEFLWVLATAPG